MEKENKKQLNQYRLQCWQERLGEFTESENVKNIRDEIGLLRIMIEEIWNQSKNDPQTLMIYSSKLSDLIMKVEKCVTSCDRLEMRLGSTLDKGTALMMASKIVDIIGQHVSDPTAIDSISHSLIDIISNTSK